MYGDRLKETLPRVQETISTAAERAGRNPADITLVAVSKGHPSEAITAALEAGLRDLGENRVEELTVKGPDFLGRDVRWHMIGQLQRRKAAGALEWAHLIHSVDSVRLGERLDRIVAESGKSVRVLAQVNVSGEEAKTGFSLAEAVEGVHRLVELPRLEVMGLMTMAPFDAEEGALRTVFAGLRELAERLKGVSAYRGTELSMGMSNDFGLAIEEGSTMIRVGSALFGKRQG